MPDYSAFTAVRQISGTNLEIDVTGTTVATVSIDENYPGQTSFTELGTIVIGEWEATPVQPQWGGTGNITLTNHGVLIGQGINPTNEIVLSAGQVLIGTTASDPVNATISGTGNQITITSSSGSIAASLPSAVVMPGTLTLNADPITSLEAATKQYVDMLASGLQVKASCYAGTTGTLNAIYLNGVAGVGATLTNAGSLAAFSTDGVSPPITSRILVKNQSSSFQNGIYTLTTVGSGAVAWILTRATDFDQASEIVPGDFVLLDFGNTLQYTAWVETVTVSTIGTDPITFTQFGASNVLSVSGTTNRITSSGGTTPVIDIAATYVGQSSITTLGTIATGVWQGTVIGSTYGGTGVNNGSSTITLGGNLVTSGAFASTFTMTGITNVTFPTSGTLATTASLPTPAALTKADDTNVTLTLGGTPSTALLQAASITAGWTGQLGLTRGGTNASLSASNGGIFYSTASAGAILSGTSTANQVLLSGSSAAPAWSTATYPATTTINQLLYSSAANTIAGVATANNGVLITSSGGVPSISSTIPNATQDNITRLGTIASIGASLGVSFGGTGNNTFTAYSVICAGTTATGAYQNVSGVGSSGNVLTSNGASALPTWQAAAAGSGSYTYISSSTASSSASITFTGLSSSYSAYVFIFSQILPATNDVDFYMRTSSNNGVSYDSGAGNYSWNAHINYSATSETPVGNDSDTKIMFNSTTSGFKIANSAGNGICGDIRIFDPSNSNLAKINAHIDFTSGSGSRSQALVMGVRLAASAVNAVQFLFSSGNIASGTVYAYGIKNS